jgi:hypothetical protein
MYTIGASVVHAFGTENATTFEGLRVSPPGTHRIRFRILFKPKYINHTQETGDAGVVPVYSMGIRVPSSFMVSDFSSSVYNSRSVDDLNIPSGQPLMTIQVADTTTKITVDPVYESIESFTYYYAESQPGTLWSYQTINPGSITTRTGISSGELGFPYDSFHTGMFGQYLTPFSKNQILCDSFVMTAEFNVSLTQQSVINVYPNQYMDFVGIGSTASPCLTELSYSIVDGDKVNVPEIDPPTGHLKLHQRRRREQKRIDAMIQRKFDAYKRRLPFKEPSPPPYQPELQLSKDEVNIIKAYRLPSKSM